MEYDRRASSLISSENLSAPDASEASAKPAVLAATVPKAAASLSPEANAAIAICSPALIASSEETIGFILDSTRFERFLRELLLAFERELLGNAAESRVFGVFKMGIDPVLSASIK